MEGSDVFGRCPPAVGRRLRPPLGGVRPLLLPSVRQEEREDLDQDVALPGLSAELDVQADLVHVCLRGDDRTVRRGMQVLVDHRGMELGLMPAGQESVMGMRVSSQTSKTNLVSLGPPSSHQVLTVATSSAISSIVHWMLVGQG